jgi:hypothetical protein
MRRWDSSWRKTAGIRKGLRTSTRTAIRRIIYPAVQTMSNYLPSVIKVAFGALTPVEAIQEIEG